MMEIKIGTYNVQNLFDKFDDPLKEDGPPKSDESKKALAEVIKTLDNDILALQEVENIEIIQEVLDLAGLKERYNIIVGKSDGRGIACALLVDKKFPIKSWTINENESLFYRPPVEAIVEIAPGFNVKFITVHFKAKMTPESKEQRIKEAKRTIEMAKKTNIPTVILGDYNDLPDSEISSIFENNGFVDVRKIDKLSKDIDSPTKILENFENWSIIDYIRVNNPIHSLVVQGSYDVLDEKEKFEVKIASDHRPVSIVIRGIFLNFEEFK
ncbi:MAG: endonuclease/exonuclease/phosphatase family protein [Candidatus Calescibacterium sp.]|nr:endonuclease/exonuclease/phosphatase family protein [Candidatus Calescibacterium sp.]MCX7972459.1 endonuclease/exonuclease/phosphatase family protein [bacterium]MDW8195649.1 endonuclease/exonuclease/phosphatase family protein [Candidatus Calescibacterium sp.]